MGQQGYLALCACSRYFDGLGVLVLDWWELVVVCSFVGEEVIGSAFWAIGGALEPFRSADSGLIWSMDREQNFREFCLGVALWRAFGTVTARADLQPETAHRGQGERHDGINHQDR